MPGGISPMAASHLLGLFGSVCVCVGGVLGIDPEMAVPS